MLWRLVNREYIIGPLCFIPIGFFIASMISITSVAYYTTPYDVITKLLIIPAAILGVMFPLLASAFTRNNIQTRHFIISPMKYMPLLMAPLVLLIILFQSEGYLYDTADLHAMSFVLHSSCVLES